MAKHGPLSGQQVAKRYQVGELLGSGGMGTVYKAQDTRLHRPVAMKMMSPAQPVSAAELQDYTQRFKEEALRLAKLKHPGIPHIYDHFEEAARWFLVMEFIEGETLKDYLQRHGGWLHVDEVFRIGFQLADVLNYLHTPLPNKPAIIFRDLKPANVMITPDGQVYLIDFGIARLFTPGKSQDTFVALSPGYAAPEQHGTAQTTVRSDIYSLGATLHHLLSGTHPAISPFLFAPLPIQQPAQLASLIGYMVAFDPANRPASMAVVKDALQRMIDQTALSPAVNVLSSPSASMLPPTVYAQAFPPASALPPTQRVLGGKFIIIEEMAEGRYAKIHKVADMNKPSAYYVAKQMVNLGIGEDVQKPLTEDVTKEVELLSGLKHPNISFFISSFQEHDEYYFVMEYVPGRNLEKMLEDTRSPLEEVQVIKWMMSICGALTYIHSHQPPIILENMQLSDIMATPEGDVRLIDMRTWRRLFPTYNPMRKRKPGAAMKLPPSLPYQSPESIAAMVSSRGLAVDARSDIYSLGAILYHLLTNYVPDFMRTQQVESILTKNPRLHTIQVNGKTVCPIEQVIIKAMQQDPELRFQNADAMRRALEYCLFK